jgi:hypothetical protein
MLGLNTYTFGPKSGSPALCASDRADGIAWWAAAGLAETVLAAAVLAAAVLALPAIRPPVASAAANAAVKVVVASLMITSPPFSSSKQSYPENVVFARC